jgi:hypothetical protein
MAMEVGAAIDAMLGLAAAPARQDRVLALRAAFEARTGKFSMGDAFFEQRSAAFWDDALTREAFGRELEAELDAEARALVEPLARAHRGLFAVSGEEELAEVDGNAWVLTDEWSGAELLAEPASTGLRDALMRAAGLVDGRVVGIRPNRVVLLPGAVFHHADAVEPMRALLPEARARGLGTHEALDALLRMDHAFRSLSRVKPAFAYRKESLPRG